MSKIVGQFKQLIKPISFDILTSPIIWKKVNIIKGQTMIKKIDVAGISVDNYTVREAIMQVEKSLESKGFYLIEEVTADMLLMAERNEKVKEAIKSVDLTVVVESEILSAVGANTMQRQHEIENHDFFSEFMKRMERNHKTIFLLGETANDIERMRKKINDSYGRIEIVGEAALENRADGTDGVVNEINSATSDVIVSLLSSPGQEIFLQENRDKLSAKIWYGLGRELLVPQKRGAIRKFFRHNSRTHMLKKHIIQYQKQEEAIKK